MRFGSGKCEIMGKITHSVNTMVASKWAITAQGRAWMIVNSSPRTSVSAQRQSKTLKANRMLGIMRCWERNRKTSSFHSLCGPSSWTRHGVWTPYQKGYEEFLKNTEEGYEDDHRHEMLFRQRKIRQRFFSLENRWLRKEYDKSVKSWKL